MGINLRLVAPQDKIWDIYGDETKVQLVKICRFDIQRFVGYAKVTSNFFADYMQNTSFRLVTVEQDPEKGNGVIINDFFLDGLQKLPGKNKGRRAKYCTRPTGNEVCMSTILF